MNILPCDQWQPRQAGFFDLPEAIYRPAPGVSQSTLKTMERSPAHCRARFDVEMKPSKAMQMGTALHSILLEPHTWAVGKSHWIRPATYIDTKGEVKPWNGNSTTCKQWMKDRAALPIYTTEEVEELGGMVQALRSHFQAGPALEQGHSEVAAFAQDEVTGRWVKARLDKVLPDLKALVDVKKVQDAREFPRKAFDMGYHIQAASNMHICRMLGMEVERFIFIAVEESAPHGIIMWEADDAFLDRGIQDWRKYLDLYAECVKNDKWPSYPANIQTLTLPKWA
jgi:exodeoxyribonuclease VIII